MTNNLVQYLIAVARRTGRIRRVRRHRRRRNRIMRDDNNNNNDNNNCDRVFLPTSRIIFDVGRSRVAGRIIIIIIHSAGGAVRIIIPRRSAAPVLGFREPETTSTSADLPVIN